jgi:predicted enzyme related to lactoylglutathione lyase
VGTRTSYPPGTFSWVDLATTDRAAAKEFYTQLFGWATEDVDAGGAATYTMCRLDGDAVAGIFDLAGDLQAVGVPPNWTSHVTVTGADAAAARADELGGTVLAEAFDVLDLGRMAVLEDPQGAAFRVWEPRGRIGADRVNDVGCLTMNELVTPDLDGARTFYGGLFGWTTEGVDTGPGGPTMAAAYNQGSLNATLTLDQAGTPPHWRAYFTVESTRAAVGRAVELGGQAVAGPIDLPDGASIARVLDPQGALFAFFEGRVDP